MLESKTHVIPEARQEGGDQCSTGMDAETAEPAICQDACAGDDETVDLFVETTLRIHFEARVESLGERSEGLPPIREPASPAIPVYYKVLVVSD